jgi:hypothetical protein
LELMHKTLKAVEHSFINLWIWNMSVLVERNLCHCQNKKPLDQRCNSFRASSGSTVS